jgi:WD40 repeat protein
MSTTSLPDLPTEILLQIISYAPTVQLLSRLSLTNRKLHTIIESEGWKVFVLARFPSIPVPPYWKDAAHALTTLSRNWDRKAFIARHFEPANTKIHCLPEGNTVDVRDKWKASHGQTMGYQPVIDSYEQWTGNTWDSRKEVVVWGAGADLIMSTTERNRRINSQWQTASKEERAVDFAADRSKRRWITYTEERHKEGRDDITTVNMVRPHLLPRSEQSRPGESVIVGRASGDLELLRLAQGQRKCIARTYDTSGRIVRAADLSTEQSPLLATCLDNTQAALFRVHDDASSARPISEISCVPETEKNCRLWSCRFLGTDKLAVGRGIAKRLVYVYGVGPDGLSSKPLRTFGGGIEKETSTSAYPIVPIPASSVCGDLAGNAFLSGGYDGLIRLHDMRSPAEYEALISDPTDFSAIFSMAMIGRERLIAGGAINSLLKVWDLRFAGGRTYHYLDALATSGGDSTVSTPTTLEEPHTGGWDVFASPYEAANRRWHRGQDSPIYSLSRPSNSSTSLYVGRENSVMQFNFTSMLDKHPDPVFKHAIVRRPGGHIDAKKTWDSDGKHRVLSLSSYVQTAQGHFSLKIQRRSDKLDFAEAIPGFDERWRPVSRKEIIQATGL